MSDLELVWRGPIDISGYGVAGRGYLWALDKAGVKVKLVDKAVSSSLVGKGMSDDVYALIDRLRNNKVDWRAPVVQHTVADRLKRRAASRLSIGYTIFELTRVPKDWVTACNAMDLIFTGSEYSRRAFVDTGVEPSKIEVLPHAIDLDKYRPGLPKLKIQNLSGFNFISVFDFQSRKAWKDLLRAYWSAFSWADNVSLALKCYRGAFEPNDQLKVKEMIETYKKGLGFTRTAKILFYGFDLPDNLMPNLYNTFDCYVALGREGFGLPGAEAQACGIPAIGPEVGGNREFMTEDCSYLVKYLKDETIDAELSAFNPTFAGLQWAVHDWQHLATIMKHVFENKDEVKEKGKKARAYVTEKLHWQVIANKFCTEVTKRLT